MSSTILNRFYESKKHIKKQIQSGGCLHYFIKITIVFRLQDFKRDVQALLLTVETYGGETFLSEDVAINILNETKKAFGRASQVISRFE